MTSTVEDMRLTFQAALSQGERDPFWFFHFAEKVWSAREKALTEATHLAWTHLLVDVHNHVHARGWGASSLESALAARIDHLERFDVPWPHPLFEDLRQWFFELLGGFELEQVLLNQGAWTRLPRAEIKRLIRLRNGLQLVLRSAQTKAFLDETSPFDLSGWWKLSQVLLR